MTTKYKQIFFVFVQNKEIADIQIKNIKSFRNELQKVKKVYTTDIDEKKADLYNIMFKNLTSFKTFTLFFMDKNNKKLY